MDHMRPDYHKTYPKSTQLQRDKRYFQIAQKKKEKLEMMSGGEKPGEAPKKNDPFTSVDNLKEEKTGVKMEKLDKLNLVNSRSVLQEVTEENTGTYKSGFPSMRKGMRKSRSTITKREPHFGKFNSLYKFKMKYGKNTERRKIDRVMNEYFET